ncbi:MAG: SDR family oxidoreductase [Chloroflexi bacterium]|nr:SDR family oxidoreductase [Chloroflexota bacterium]
MLSNNGAKSNGARLSGKVAVITGAAGGIGAATARLFAHEGAKLSILDLDEDRLGGVAAELETVGAKVVHMVTDVTDSKSVQKLVDVTLDRFGRIDILLNIAGLTRDCMSWKMTDDQWNLCLDVNLRGTFNCCRAVLPIMRSQGYGKIVNTSSVSSLGNIGQVNYAAAKAGVSAMTKTLALEVAKFGINVNCVAPGFIDTMMTQAMRQDVLKRVVEEKVPLGRMGRPEEVGKLYLYLVSDDASFMTGQVVFLDGGISVGI